MKKLLAISLLLICNGAWAQQTIAGVKNAVHAYHQALIEKDAAALNALLHDALSFGHSNGWVEGKAAQKANLFNGVIAYHGIAAPELQVTLAGDIATVRGKGSFDVDYKNKRAVFDLYEMQTWVWEQGRWQLLNRQSVNHARQGASPTAAP
jgi:ketosteroid isomerase-like protein